MLKKVNEELMNISMYFAVIHDLTEAMGRQLERINSEENKKKIVAVIKDEIKDRILEGQARLVNFVAQLEKVESE